MDVLAMIRHTLVPDGTNPITQHFRLSRHVASAGPEMVWKIYDAVRIKDGKDASVFFFEKKVAEKLHKPKRREIVTEILRREVSHLMRIKHHKTLRVLHSLEECNDSLAFATEPVIASLANLLGNCERLGANVQQEFKDFSFLDIEIKSGLLQVIEGLHHLHTTEHMLHLNICPQSVIVTKRGMWKLAGFGFAQSSTENSFSVNPWMSKHSKMAQPDLDYIAPEIQMATMKYATAACDIFSLGMLTCSVYNAGRSLVQAGYSTTNYGKQLERLSDLLSETAHKLPVQLMEPVERMISKDARYRPSTQYLMSLKFFDDPVVACMQSLDAVDYKDLSQKCEFFAILPPTISQFPRKLLYDSVFPMLKEQMEYPDMLLLALPSFVALIGHATDDDYKELIQPELRKVIAMTRPVQATVYLLEKLDVLLGKASEEETKSEILPMIFSTLESNSIQGQEAAINVFSTIKKYLDDHTMRKLVLPKAKTLFNKSSNVRTKLNALECIDRLLGSLEKMMILDDILPFLTEIQCSDVDIIMSIVSIYKHLLSDKKFGLTHNLLATKVMPTLIPLSVTPGLSIIQFNSLMEVLHDMLDQIERQRLQKMMNEMPDHEVFVENRRLSPDMRYSHLANYDGTVTSKCLLNVDDKYYTKYRPPSTPELMTNGSQEWLGPRAYRRHSSFQGLGMAEQAVLDTVVRQRRASIINPQQQLPASVGYPHILVSEASVSDLKESPYGSTIGINRRASTVSTGPVLIPDVGRRDSFGRLVARGSDPNRRSSFQGICETAMQFFGAKL